MLVPFEILIYGAKVPVYINPNHVVMLREDESPNETRMILSSVNSCVVAGTLQEVAQALQGKTPPSLSEAMLAHDINSLT